MNITIEPRSLRGRIQIPSSKSVGHRELICAAMADGTSVIDGISRSEDIDTTCGVLRAFGVKIHTVPSSVAGRICIRVHGGMHIPPECTADCGESGSTLRFLIPAALMQDCTVTFTGHGRLPKRPLGPYEQIFDKKNILYHHGTDALPFTVRGRLTPGYYELPGNVSSQFISGLLFCLPLLGADSVIVPSAPVESEGYIRLTASVMKKYGVIIEEEAGRLKIPGGQSYTPCRSTVEGDDSQAAFWIAAGTMGGKIICEGLNPQSVQSDKIMQEFVKEMGGNLRIRGNTLTSSAAPASGIQIDGSDCPDAIPVLAVLAACSEGTTKISKIGRLRYKESDRLHMIAECLNQIGGDAEELPEGLVIQGKQNLRGGTVSSGNDHRIAMAMAIAAIRCKEPLTITGAESVNKSYPKFWEDYESLGGRITRS